MATALAALALTGCGTEDPAGRNVSVKASATPPSPEEAGFLAMLAKVARPCPASGETEPGSRPTGPGPRDTRPTGTGPAEQHTPAPGETPPTAPIEPGAPTGPEAELNDYEWCASGLHEERVVRALQAVSKPTPAKVRKTLNDLGYIDARIHDLKQDGKVTRFHLDLRAPDSRLCEEGAAAGETTDVNACVASATGPFTVTTPAEVDE
ncbi:hypothetical protein [Streptomyces sp. NPDC046821]|uniref:hypothetical protein n=1 Tax=Streptomyces sp. NPDC046821 TaxID=3154702 RepID=UPI0033D016F3